MSCRIDEGAFRLSEASKRFEFDGSTVVQLRNDVGTVRTKFAQTLGALRLGIAATEGAHTELSNIHTLLRTFDNRVARIWTALQGYYYHPCYALDNAYLPVHITHELNSRRWSPEGTNVRQELVMYGLRGGTDYSTRVREWSPKGLVVADLCGTHDKTVSTQFFPDTREFVVALQNRTTSPQWVMWKCRLTDPNNVSASANRQIYKQLGKLVKNVLPQVRKGALSLDPGRYTEIRLPIGELPDSIFYSLLEFDLFIDFAWNWLSCRLVQPTISSWMASGEYQTSLPGQRRPKDKG